MARRIVVWAGLVVVVLAACGDDDAVTATQPPATTQATTTTTEAVQALQPGPVTSLGDIAGTYQRQGPGRVTFMHFFEDETFWHGSANRDLVEDRPTNIMDARFEGTKVFVSNSKGTCGDDPEVGVADPDEAIYEIHVLENGNLQLVVIEDTCAARSTMFQAEYAAVP